MANRIGVRARLSPSIGLKAEITRDGSAASVLSPTLSAQTKANAIYAKWASQVFKASALLDELRTNPFVFDEVSPQDGLIALAIVKVASESQAYSDDQSFSFSKFVADPQYFGEVIQFVIVFTRDLSDTLAPLDLGTVMSVGINKADIQALLDTATLAVGKVVTDASPAIEATAIEVVKPFADPQYLGEVIQFALTYVRQFTELVSLSETINTFGVGKTLAEQSAILDDIAKSLGLSWSDSSSIADSPAIETIKPFADPSYYGEVIQFLIYFGRDFLEDVTFVETINSFFVAKSLADAPVFDDSPAIVFETAFADSLSFSDIFGLLQVRTFAETVYFNPYGGLVNDLLVNGVPIGGTLGGDTIQFGTSPDRQDASTYDDSFARDVGFIRLFADNNPADDVLVTLVQYARTFIETFSMDDLFDRQVGYSPSYSDSQGATDALTTSVGYGREFTDGSPYSDAQVFLVAPQYADAQPTDDALSNNFAPVWSDSQNFSDIFGFYSERTFFDTVYFVAYGGDLDSAPINSAALNSAIGGDFAYRTPGQVSAESQPTVDATAFGISPAYSDSQGFGDSDYRNIQPSLADAPTHVDGFNTFDLQKVLQDANTLLETQLTISTTSVTTVPGTLNRAVINALPLNQQGVLTTVITVQVI